LLSESCEYAHCKTGFQSRVVVTKWVGGQVVTTMHYCSLLHMVMGTLEDYANEKKVSGTKAMKQLSRMAVNIMKKLLAQGEKEWKEAEKKR
jgi:hypothetical protein